MRFHEKALLFVRGRMCVCTCSEISERNWSRMNFNEGKKVKRDDDIRCSGTQLSREKPGAIKHLAGIIDSMAKYPAIIRAQTSQAYLPSSSISTSALVSCSFITFHFFQLYFSNFHLYLNFFKTFFKHFFFSYTIFQFYSLSILFFKLLSSFQMFSKLVLNNFF